MIRIDMILLDRINNEMANVTYSLIAISLETKYFDIHHMNNGQVSPNGMHE